MAARRQIVVVDDDDSFRESLCDLLLSHGFGVRAFASAEELLSNDAWFGADCLLVDASMPGATGIELQLSLQQRGNPSPLIFVTGYEDRALRALVLAEGAVAYLCKPFEEEQLLSALARAFAATARG